MSESNEESTQEYIDGLQKRARAFGRVRNAKVQKFLDELQKLKDENDNKDDK